MLYEDHSIAAFRYVIDLCEVRPPYMPSSDFLKAKQINHIDRHCRTFIGSSPMVILASCHPDRGADVSPRRDAPGFVRVLGLVRLTRARHLLDTMAVEGKTPKLAIVVEVREAYPHC